MNSSNSRVLLKTFRLGGLGFTKLEIMRGTLIGSELKIGDNEKKLN